jgi:hypothetical protein
MDYREYLKDFLDKIGYGLYNEDSGVFKIRYLFNSKKPELLERQLSKIVKLNDDFVIIQNEKRSRREGTEYMTFSTITAVHINRIVVEEITVESK